jgi:hypothetical protein
VLKIVKVGSLKSGFQVGVVKGRVSTLGCSIRGAA